MPDKRQFVEMLCKPQPIVNIVISGRGFGTAVSERLIRLESAEPEEIGAQGISLFAYGPATKDGTDDEYLRKMKEAVFQQPATVPKMDWIK